MNDETRNPNSLEELAGDLRVAVAHLKGRPVPQEAMQRALDRAALCSAPVRSAPRSRRRALLGIAAAVAACLALGVWFLRPSDAWADVVEAVQTKPWIHGTLRVPGAGQSSEFWISTSRTIGGMRSAEQITFFDNPVKLIYRYEPKRGVLYRLPASTSDLAQGEQLLELFQALFRGDAELKTELPDMYLADQKRTQTEKNGRRWDEYNLRFSTNRSKGYVEMTILVDAQTRLPHSIRERYSGVEWTFDYPESGPSNIYALGVPKNAKLVDRVPTGDMSRILAAIQSGRNRFDDFHAIVVRDSSSDLSNPKHPRPIPSVFAVWKKGDRWRVEMAVAPANLVQEGVPDVKDKMGWLRDACKGTVFTALNVCDGKRIYEGEMPGQNFEFLETADEPYPADGEARRAMPFLWCYPISFPPPNDRTEETVDTGGRGGRNYVVVTSRLVDFRGHDPARTLPFQRFWLDPARDYPVVEYEVFRTDPAATPLQVPVGQEHMYQWEQTPSGVWYPTRVNSGAYWYHFFLDFQADLPDELFRPERRTVLTDRYPAGP